MASLESRSYKKAYFLSANTVDCCSVGKPDSTEITRTTCCYYFFFEFNDKGKVVIYLQPSGCFQRWESERGGFQTVEGGVNNKFFENDPAAESGTQWKPVIAEGAILSCKNLDFFFHIGHP